MEFPSLGENCSEASCKQLDFLPIRCGGCHKVFCRLHASAIRGHTCSREFGLRDNVVPECPLCHQPIPLGAADARQGEARMAQHLQSQCQLQPARELKGKLLSNRCQVPGCKRREFVPMQCSQCGLNYCIAHRLEVDHNCKPGQKAPALSPSALAAMRRALLALHDAKQGPIVTCKQEAATSESSCSRDVPHSCPS